MTGPLRANHADKLRRVVDLVLTVRDPFLLVTHTDRTSGNTATE